MERQSSDDYAPLRGAEDLVSVFHAAEKPNSGFLLGAEAEKFGVHGESGAPLAYAGDHGVARVLGALTRFGWQPERETDDGPVIALRRGAASITLEPGAQLELSGAALPNVHEVQAEFAQHLAELSDISKEMGLVWLGVGFHPLAAQADLPWVPKQRYGIMREYLPPLGSAAHDMMRRTSTVQVNIDYANEEDAMRKLRVGLLLSPLLNALTANSPFREGVRSDKKSLRGAVWLHMDPSRSGIVRRVLSKRHPSYRDYAEWALDAGMFLVKRNGNVLANTGQTFRDFLANGFRGERATQADWKLHLNTLFPDVRLKNTLELRSCDSLPLSLSGAVPALAAGLFYDERALSEAETLAETLGAESVDQARHDLATRALSASIGGVSARALGERLLEIARGGLERRARIDERGQTESVHLEPLITLVQQGKAPADALVEGVAEGERLSTAELIRRTRVDA
ncbi:MAG: glutamate-cysteine ligase family protein [Polyangiaceae bacterium]